MLGRTEVCLLIVAMIIAIVSCTKIDSFKAPEEGGLAIEELGTNTWIPSKYGNLVSVSYRAKNDHFSLWFQDEDGSIRFVVYNPKKNQLWSRARLIPRK